MTCDRINVPTAVQNLVVCQGTTLTVKVFLRGVDMTGYHAWFIVREQADPPSAGALVFELFDPDDGIVITPTTTDPSGSAAGLATCTSSDAQSAPLTGAYNWEVRLTSPAGESMDPFKGTFTVEASAFGTETP